MSYGSPPPGPRRVRLRTLLLVTASLVPACLVGWPVVQSVSGSDDDGAKGASARPTASDRSASPPSGGQPGAASGTPSSPAASTSAGGDGPGGKDGGKDEPREGEDGGTGGGRAPTGPLSGKAVVIDPGHNPRNREHTREIARLVDIGTNRKECDTTGAATDSGYSEARFTLDVSRRIRTLLASQGATVKFTQDDDRAYGPCVDERARVGNEAKADAVVSVHADGSAVGNRGFHVILPAAVKGGEADTSKIVGPSRELGERIAGNFVRETGSVPSNYIGGGTGLDVRSDLGGLNLSTVPKVFIECGNMRDPKDAERLTSAKWRQSAARGIAEGVTSFLEP
ncbi:N-acetylmuramoyl-L-alanine amidase [Streptomyces sp. 8N706]|uniref:N-acetylmuramoyl-L-alanine amidase n=1 Tax=Streptomyces sp. 8N706 TaxID=3457416 RepID=UPI003FD36D84